MNNMIRQMKLVTGEEIICEIIDFEDDDGSAIVIRNPVSIDSINRPDGTRIHILQAWMIYQFGDEVFQTLNADMVVAEASPANEVLEEYYRKIKSENDEDASEEEVEAYINKLKNLVGDIDKDMDSDSSAKKVIVFPGNTKIH